MKRRDMLSLMGAAGICGAGRGDADDVEPPRPGGAAAGPLAGSHAHFCGIHMAKRDPKFQLITHHYCTAHGDAGHQHEQMFQCLLYDRPAGNARLLGVEYVISDRAYRALPAVEKKFWHAHTYEVLAGGLIAPQMSPEDELEFMKVILPTWGKAWHTWPDPKTDVPLGEPLLMWSLMGDGQADAAVLAARDREFRCNTEQIRENRCRRLGLEAPDVAAPASLDSVGRQWTNAGDDLPRRRSSGPG